MPTIIQAAEFKAKCLKLMDEVAISGQPITITKHGRPIAQLVPAPSTSGALLGDLHGTVSIGGDVVTPLESDWPAPKG